MSLVELEDTMIPWIGRTGKMMGSFIAENFKKYHLNLTIEQWALLKRLYDKDGQMQNDLAVITQLNKASLIRLEVRI